MLSDSGRTRRIWPFVLLGSVVVLGLLAAAGTWIYGISAMSDPEKPLLVGMRIDGSRVSVKAPTCPTDTVGKVEVFDSESEKALWRASGPKTPAGKRGELTLWDVAGFAQPGPQTQPERLPAKLEVAFEYGGGEDGTGDVFDTAKVEVADLPDGHYWTYDGPMTAAAIDGQLPCGSDG